jgi:hypothetical protein
MRWPKFKKNLFGLLQGIAWQGVMAKNNFLAERVARFAAKERRCKFLRGMWDWLAIIYRESAIGRKREIRGGWASGKRLVSRGGVTEKWQTKKWKSENDIWGRDAITVELRPTWRPDGTQASRSDAPCLTWAIW